MATDILYPKVSLETNSGTISRWHVKDGDLVRQGQLLFEIDNDKTVVEVDAPHDGTLKILRASTSDEIDVGQSVASLFLEDETISSIPAIPASEPTAGLSPESKMNSANPASDIRSHTTQTGRAIATPLAKRLAGNAGIDLSQINGSGPSGRIQKKDIIAAIETQQTVGNRSHESSDTALNAVWLRKGEGTPIVLLHGFASDHNNWRGLFAGTQWQQPLLAIDLPSHGASSLDLVENLDAIAERVEATIRQLNLSQTIVVGHSFGAAVSTRLAVRGNIDIRALGLFSPAGLGPEINSGFVENFIKAKSKESVTPWLHELVHAKDVISDAFIYAVVHQRQNQSLSDAMGAFAKQFFADGTQTISIANDLASLEIPVRVVFGKQDRILPFKHSRNLPDNVALHAFDACGHMPHLEKRALSLRILQELVSSARN
ncbi:acetoin dehydrogenase dihydrolipoyllysine-residue acetyltransferase subunit [Ochrobactrum sp. P6BS-III]|uniref:acetoin dehydrogenase dihydrolipoyllysine-residue acetyltransferase subunit n=1 Tax=unclassified Ochrobactrum TaxID=239106 RepID=UPI000992576F|nr:pyruvate dehydrogenase E2 component (dihydrolipoamide acetyltransferase) [Ochrobactrum sp. P6BSIII]OOL16797.1 acetoin dehydrogenase dihydrolipoyllysine-residue acetyltransferase subunit [Ochrobactrum sp. P6BS-III]